MTALHILVAVRELGIRIGGPTSIRREAIVDVGNAHSFAEAEATAKVRAARKWKTNIICVQVTETRLALPEEPEVLFDSAKADRDKPIPYNSLSPPKHSQAPTLLTQPRQPIGASNEVRQLYPKVGT